MDKNSIEYNYNDLIFKGDGHYTPKGHLFISEIIFTLESALFKNNDQIKGLAKFIYIVNYKTFISLKIRFIRISAIYCHHNN